MSVRRPHGRRRVGRRAYVLSGVTLISGLAVAGAPYEPVASGLSDSQASCLKRVLEGDPVAAAPFWRLAAEEVSSSDVGLFRQWYANASFRDVSPQFGSAQFMKGPVGQSIDFDDEGRLVFTRSPDDRDAHTMIELSVGGDASRGHFVPYGGYRTMRLGVPYEIRFSVHVDGSAWWREVPWAVILQGHAIPDGPKRGAKFNPPFAVVVTRGQWEIHVRADDRRVLREDRKYRRFDRIPLGAVRRGESLDVAVRVVWGYTDAGAGMSVWRDGRLIRADINRSNFYDTRAPSGESMGPYITFGAYMPLADTRRGEAIVRFSRLEVGGGSWLPPCSPSAHAWMTSEAPSGARVG